MRVRPNCCRPTPNTDSDAIFALSFRPRSNRQYCDSPQFPATPYGGCSSAPSPLALRSSGKKGALGLALVTETLITREQHFHSGSFATEPFRASAEQCPLCLR
jgi:hypothetical protein